jgi:hypothetical protein
MEPTIVTIQKTTAAFPEGSGSFKVDDEVTITGKITASDDQGMTVEVANVEKAPDADAAPAPDSEGTAPEADAGDNAQADYVMSKRKGLMGNE